MTLAVYAGVLLVYTALPTRNYYWDGITFAHMIENAASYRELLHPNHLIYNFVGYALYSAVNTIAPGTRALYVLQYLNCILGAACAVTLFRILRSFVSSRNAAAALTFLFAFSATWWKYSTDADAYVASVLCLLICFYFVLPTEKPRPFVVAGLHVAAMLFHQLAVFFFPVIVIGLFFQTREQPKRKQVTALASYTGCAAGGTFVMYAAAYCWMTGGIDPVGLSKWLTSYSPEIGFVFNAADSLRYTLRGTVQLFFGGRFSFLKEVPTALAIVFLGLIAAGLVWLVAEIARKRNDPRAQNENGDARPTIILLLVWIATYMVFLFFFIPQNTFYRLFYFPAVIILIGLGLTRLGPKAMRLLPPVAAIAALANFLLYVYPHSRVRHETPLALATQLQSVWSPKAVVFYSVMTSDAQLARYFNPKAVWIEIKKPTPAGIEAEMQNMAGHDLWLETSAIRELARTSEGSAWLLHRARISPDEPSFHVGDPFDVTFIPVH